MKQTRWTSGPSVWPGFMVTREIEDYTFPNPMEDGNVTVGRQYDWIGFSVWARWRKQGGK